MTVQNTNSRTDSVANGVQTVFPYDFLLLKEANLTVLEDGAVTAIDYSVSGVGSQTGGNIIFDTPPANGVVVTAIRVVPLTQDIEYTEYDSFPAKTHERGLDFGVMRHQQQEESASRTLRYPVVGAPAGGTELKIPAPFLVIGYDADGNLTNVDVGGAAGAPVRNPLQTLLDAGGNNITNIGEVEAATGNIAVLTAAVSVDTTALTAAAVDTTSLTKAGVDVLNQAESDAAYDAAGLAGVVQGNLDTHIGNAGIHFEDAPADGSRYARKDAAWEAFTSLINPMTTPGDIIVGGAAGAPNRLAIGAEGTRPRVVGGNLAYQIPPGYEWVETLTASASASLDFTDLDQTKDHLFLLNWVRPANDAVTLYVRTSPDSGGSPTYLNGASSYSYSFQSQGSTYITYSAVGNTSTVAQLTADVGNAASEDGVEGVLEMRDPGNAATRTFMDCVMRYYNAGGFINRTDGFAGVNSIAVTQAIRFFFSAGNIASGSISHYERHVQ